MGWDRKTKAHEPPKVYDLDAESVITPDVTQWAVEETPDPREGAAPVDTYVHRPRREAALPEI